MPPFSNVDYETAEIDVSNSPVKDRSFVRPRRVVRFHEHVEERPIFAKACSSNIRDMIWYSKEEIAAMKQDCARAVKLILMGQRPIHTIVQNEQHGLERKEEFCDRGLEDMTKAASIQVRSRRQFATRIVLNAQADQKDQGICHDEESLAESYRLACARSVAAAIARGMSDAEAALR